MLPLNEEKIIELLGLLYEVAAGESAKSWADFFNQISLLLSLGPGNLSLSWRDTLQHQMV